MTDLTEQRIANWTKVAATLWAFADRQEARAPGQMDHITHPAQEAAALAELIVAAYCEGDKAKASERRQTYAEHMSRYSFLQGL